MKKIPCIRFLAGKDCRRGDTLVEVLIAMVLFLFIFMAVLSTALLATDSNTKNMLRNEAVSIAAQSMSGARNIAFTNLPNSVPPANPSGPVTNGLTCTPNGPAVSNAVAVIRNFRNFQETFCVTNAVDALDANPNNHDLVTVTVTWDWKGRQQPQYQIQSVIGQSVIGQ
ncbi:MAG: prepilin-type N-terminal cleavage/methylation domain-containing protein [Nitrospiraceae bacterium]|nr:prepilin-type N-terminal cleavage/methylation domain-containing protein [Nitrospiraceae bacterium]